VANVSTSEDSRLIISSRRISIALIAVAACIYFAFLLKYPDRAILSILSDDAFYYFKIAQNIVAGLGPTFDGIVPTNGFHPLWMLLMIVVYGIAGSSLQGPVVMVMCMCGALGVGTLVLLWKLVDRQVAPGFALVSLAGFLLPNLLNATVNGMETSLQLFALTGLLLLCYKRRLLEPDAGGRAPAILGIAIGIVTLCRLDSVFLILAAVLLSLADRQPMRAMVMRITRMIAGFSLIMIPYFIWNVAVFGHLTPISGRAKSAFPALVNNGFLYGDKALGALMIVVLLGMLATTILIDRRRGHREHLQRSPLILLAVASVFHFVNVSVFLSWGVYWWHFTMYGLAIVIALAQMTYRITSGRPVLATAAIIVMVVLFIGGSITMKSRELNVRYQQHAGWKQAAGWARHFTDKDAVMAIVDAGLFGYYSERRVINLDGKANGYEFLEAVNADRVDAYLAGAGTTHIANLRVDYRDGKYRIPIPRVNRQTVGLIVHEEWEVFRSDPVPSSATRFGATGETHFVIWKLPNASESGRGISR